MKFFRDMNARRGKNEAMDKNEAEDRFKELSKAYEVLMDRNLRHAYDRLREGQRVIYFSTILK